MKLKSARRYLFKKQIRWAVRHGIIIYKNGPDGTYRIKSGHYKRNRKRIEYMEKVLVVVNAGIIKKAAKCRTFPFF